MIFKEIHLLDVNDNIKEMHSIKDFLFEYTKPEKVELLPYHAMGENKYSAIGKEQQSCKTPDEKKIQQLKEIFD